MSAYQPPSLAEVRALAEKSLGDPESQQLFELKFGISPQGFSGLLEYEQVSYMGRFFDGAKAVTYSVTDIPADVAIADIILVQDEDGVLPAKIACILTKCEAPKRDGYYLRGSFVEPDDKAISELMRGGEASWRIKSSDVISPIDILNPRNRLWGMRNSFLKRDRSKSAINDVCNSGVRIFHYQCLASERNKVIEMVIAEATAIAEQGVGLAQKQLEALQKVQGISVDAEVVGEMTGHVGLAQQKLQDLRMLREDSANLVRVKSQSLRNDGEGKTEATNLRAQAMELLQRAHEIDGLKPYMVEHEQNSAVGYAGSENLIVWSASMPDESALKSVLKERINRLQGDQVSVAGPVGLGELIGSGADARVVLGRAHEKLSEGPSPGM